MNPASLSLGVAFVAGLISFISPCVLPLVPAYIGYMGGRVTHTVSAQVADTGRGIPASDLSRIFDRRYRTDQDREDRPGGTGLGLAIAQQILQLHGSSMEVESIVGVGTTFQFDLPAKT